ANSRIRSRDLREATLMTTIDRSILPLGAGAVVALMLIGLAWAQTTTPTNSLPDPYRSIENLAKMPEGRRWGSTRRRGGGPGRQEHLGGRALRRVRSAVADEARHAVRLRRLASRSRPQVRRVGQAGGAFRRRDAALSAWRQRLGHRQSRPRWQRASGVQVQPRG